MKCHKVCCIQNDHITYDMDLIKMYNYLNNIDIIIHVLNVYNLSIVKE